MPIGTETSFSGVSDKFLEATSDEIEGDTDDEEEEEDSGGRVGFVETGEDEHEHHWGPSVPPERWDVLGLGQAMVIPMFFIYHIITLFLKPEVKYYVMGARESLDFHIRLNM